MINNYYKSLNEPTIFPSRDKEYMPEFRLDGTMNGMGAKGGKDNAGGINIDMSEFRKCDI